MPQLCRIVSFCGKLWGKVSSQFPKIQQRWEKVFGGVHELSIDSKGRLAIPAKFRDLLARHYTPSLVVTVEARTHLVMYPEAEWQRTAENLQAMNVSGNPAARMFRDLMLNHAETLDLDASGRILLPPSLRRRVQFDKEVTLVGRADRLELWNRERWEANMNAVLDMDPDELAEQLDKAGFRL